MRVAWASVLLSLAACSTEDTLPIGGGTLDAGVVERDASVDIQWPDVVAESPTFNGGGPFACGNCTCDGTLFACFIAARSDGGCAGGGGPPRPPTADADVADASDAAQGACGAYWSCTELPAVCLPDPTCDCITNVTGLGCAVDPSGNGLQLMCPSVP